MTGVLEIVDSDLGLSMHDLAAHIFPGAGP